MAKKCEETGLVTPTTEAVFNDSATRKKVYQIFAHYDGDNDGQISLKELSFLIQDKQCKELPLPMARKIIREYDANGDGKLSFEEFYRLTRMNKRFFIEIMTLYILRLIPLRDGGEYKTHRQQLRFKMSCMPPPITMLVFSILQIILFVLDTIYINKIAKDEQRSEDMMNATISEALLYDPEKRYEFWRFLSYMFVHVDVAHLLKNLFFQIFLGIPLEIMHKWWRVLIIYFAGGLFGSLSTSVASPLMPLAGASGGVYALLTAHAATVILNWSEMVSSLPQIAVIIIFCACDFGISVHNYRTGNSRVGFVAHVAGAIAGLLVGIGILRNLKERRWQRILWWIAVCAFSVIGIVEISINILCPAHFLPGNHK